MGLSLQAQLLVLLQARPISCIKLNLLFNLVCGMGLACKSTSSWACLHKPIRLWEGDLATIINRKLDSLWPLLDLMVVRAIRFSLAYCFRDRSSLLFLSLRDKRQTLVGLGFW